MTKNDLEKMSLGEIIRNVVLVEMEISYLIKIGIDRADNPLPAQAKYLNTLYAELDRREEVYTSVPQRKVYT